MRAEAIATGNCNHLKAAQFISQSGVKSLYKSKRATIAAFHFHSLTLAHSLTHSLTLSYSLRLSLLWLSVKRITRNSLIR